jgi:cell division protein FtsL
MTLKDLQSKIDYLTERLEESEGEAARVLSRERVLLIQKKKELISRKGLTKSFSSCILYL